MLLFLASPAFAGEVKLRWSVPCFKSNPVQCDTVGVIREHGLAGQGVWAVRFSDGDTLYLGEIPEIGKECGADSADFEFEPGTVGVLIMRARSLAGVYACRYASYVFAIPADSTWVSH